MALYFDYLIFFTTQGISNIFLEIIETEQASHLIVYRLYFFPLNGRSNRHTTWFYYFIECLDHYNNSPRGLWNGHLYISSKQLISLWSLSVEFVIHGYTALRELTLLNERYFEENKMGLYSFCLCSGIIWALYRKFNSARERESELGEIWINHYHL